MLVEAHVRADAARHRARGEDGWVLLAFPIARPLGTAIVRLLVIAAYCTKAARRRARLRHEARVALALAIFGPCGARIINVAAQMRAEAT